MPAGTGDSGPDVAFGSSTQPTTWGPGSETPLPPIKLEVPTPVSFPERIIVAVSLLKESFRQMGGRKEAK